jgi:hypothetical protein
MINPHIFREYDIRGVADQDYDVEFARLLGRAYATYVADKGVKRYYRQTNGEQGKQLKVRGYICGPLQPYRAGEFAFQCRSRKSAAKRYKAFWVSKS